MKKLVCLLLALMMAASLAACGAGSSSSSGGTVSAGGSASGTAADTDSWQEKGTPLADLRIRQALAYAIDMDTIVETLFKGKAEVANSMTSPGEWLATGLKEYKYDPEMAKTLLAEAGWPADYVLDVVYYYDDQQTVDLMTIIGQYWSAVGVKAQFRKLEGDLPAQLWVPPADRVNGPSEVKWDIAYAAVAALVEHEFYDRFSSTASNNSTVPKNETLDELIAATNATALVDEQIPAFHALQKEMADNLFCMPLYHQVAFIYTSDLLDVKGAAFGNDQFSYDKGILDWVIDRKDNTLYTNGGPQEFFHAPIVNPGFFMYQELVFDRLINADADLNPTDGLLAESYSVSDDQKNLEFVLREGATWHDGQPLTPEDVRFTIELLMRTPGTNSVATSTFNAIKGAEAFLDGTAEHLEGITIDGNKISIEFEKIAPNMLATFSQWPVLPQHLLKNANPETLQQDPFWQKPVGSGPFKVGEVVLNNYTTLTRWDGYYKTGTGNIQTIHMFASGEGDANLVKNAGGGMIDYAWSKSTEEATAIEGISGMQVHTVNVRYTRVFYMNQFPHEPNIK